MTAIDRDEWPVHQPEAYDAPIPGRHWYSGCEPGGDWDPEAAAYTGTGPRVNPATGRCESCGEAACPDCGRENCPDHDRRHEKSEMTQTAIVEQAYSRPEAVEMREAYAAREAARRRWEAAVDAMRAAGWRPAGANRWEPPEAWRDQT